MTYRILVVEDEPQIRELIEEFLLEAGYHVSSACDGLEAYSLFKSQKFDLIVTDVMMPNIDGYALCQLIRQENKEIPIIFLTALNEEQDEVQAFDLQADDFLTKPFSFEVLMRRVEAVLRRSKAVMSSTTQEASEWLTFKDLKLNVLTFRCYLYSEEVELTLKEFNIVRQLIESSPRVVTREALLNQVWGYDYAGDDRTIDTHIKNIRKKINSRYLKTVKGVGYVFDEMV